MKMKHRIILLLSCCLWLFGLQAQTVRTITVAQGVSYTDHISLKEDVKDMDLMVKFVFNEENNTLAVSLISYRMLFTFWDNVHYKPLIKGRTLRPDQLPYVVEYDPKDKYKVTKLFRATIPQPKEDFYFRRWIEYEGLQPAPLDYKMVNDFITQTFDIQNKRTLVTVKLRDVFLMDKIEKKKYSIYEIPLGRDLDIEYKVTIQRNPCFGMDEEIAAAKGALESVSASYASLSKNYNGRAVPSEDALKLFNTMKGTLQDQFKRKEINSPCPDIQTTWETYNQFVDSINTIKCVVRSADEVEETGVLSPFAPDALKALVSKARLIDKMVSRWLVSTDPMERHDLVYECQDLIDEVNETYGKLKGRTPEQQQSIAIFRAAEQYFINTCKKDNK